MNQVDESTGKLLDIQTKLNSDPGSTTLQQEEKERARKFKRVNTWMKCF